MSVSAESDAATMAELARQFVTGLPVEEQPRQVERILDALVGIYRRYEAPLPAWLRDLRPEATELDAVTACPPYLHVVECMVTSELIRANLREAVMEHPRGFAGVARELGVRRAVFRRFMAGSPITIELWDSVSAYALQHRCGPPDYGSLGLAVAVSTLPLRLRERARTSLAEHLSLFLEAMGERCPDWLTWETDWPYG